VRKSPLHSPFLPFDYWPSHGAGDVLSSDIFICRPSLVGAWVKNFLSLRFSLRTLLNFFRIMKEVLIFVPTMVRDESLELNQLSLGLKMFHPMVKVSQFSTFCSPLHSQFAHPASLDCILFILRASLPKFMLFRRSPRSVSQTLLQFVFCFSAIDCPFGITIPLLLDLALIFWAPLPVLRSFQPALSCAISRTALFGFHYFRVCARSFANP